MEASHPPEPTEDKLLHPGALDPAGLSVGSEAALFLARVSGHTKLLRVA